LKGGQRTAEPQKEIKKALGPMAQERTKQLNENLRSTCQALKETEEQLKADEAIVAQKSQKEQEMQVLRQKIEKPQ